MNNFSNSVLFTSRMNGSRPGNSSNGAWHVDQLSNGQRSQLLAWTAVTVTISSFGVFTNILVLLITWPKATRTSRLNLLIFHYIAVNFIMCLLGMPTLAFELLAILHGHAIPSTLCRFTMAIYTVLSQVINWCDATLAINRCIAMFLPHNYQRLTSRPILGVMMALTWVASACPVVSMEVGIGGVDSVLPIGRCVYIPSRDALGHIYTVLIAAPYGLAGVGALLLLWKSIRFSVGADNATTGPLPIADVARTNLAGQRKRLREMKRRQMARALLGMFLWSGLCVVPWGVITVNFPYLYAREPVSLFWLRTSFACQYAVSPVCFSQLDNAVHVVVSLVIFTVKFVYSETL